AVQLQREPLRHVSDHRLDARVVPAGLQRLPGARRRLDDVEDRPPGDAPLDGRRDGGGLPARPLAPSLPGGYPDRLHPPDHDPRPADRRLAARAVHEHLPLDAVARDGGVRPVGVHDAVRDPAGRRAPARVRRGAGARGRRPRREHLPAPAARRPAADPARHPRGRSVRVHALARRVHHHVLPHRGAQHPADLHLHAGQVRDYAGGQRRRVDAARSVAPAARLRVRAAADRAPYASARAREDDMTIRIATAPVSWGIWEQTIDRPDLIPAETFLHTIVELGYTATEARPATSRRTRPRPWSVPNGTAWS